MPYKIYNILKHSKFLILFYFQLLINPIKNECNKTSPILKNGICSLIYCSEEEYNNETCKIDNEIIKTQWLNNIIRIGDINFRYVNFANYSNGDMIVETTACLGSSKRMFYGIKTNGRAFFSNNSETKKTYYFSLDVNEQPGNEDNYRYEAEIFIATLNEGEDKGKEYLVSIAKGEQYTELYNFNNGEICFICF